MNDFWKRFCMEITRKTLVYIKQAVEETMAEQPDEKLAANIMCLGVVIQLVEGLQKTKAYHAGK